jgi:2-oxoisovalerate dehydrogenase E1 component
MSSGVHIRVIGDGPPLALLHGWGFNGDAMRETATALGERHAVHVVDLPGHGASAMPAAGYELDAVAETIASALPPGSMPWVGWSLGGLLALAVAARHPERVRCIALLAASPRLTRAEDWPHGIPEGLLRDFGRRLREDYAGTVREFIELQTMDTVDRERKAEIERRLVSSPPASEALDAAVELLSSADLREASSELDIPAMLVAPQLDTLVPAAMADDWCARWPALEVVRIPGAAHLPFVSHPTEVLAALDRFLVRCSRAEAVSRRATRDRAAGDDTRPATRNDTMSNAPSSTPQGSNLRLPPATLVALYRSMRRMRAFDQRVAELFEAGEIKGTAHSYVGEEAVAAGVCTNLGPGDYIASNHRGHGHCIGKGARTDLMMAELMGRATGYCRGLGGSMHIADLDLNILGANGIVGAAMPLSCGAALAAQLRGDGQVVVAFFGDGASNQGVFHESMNLASVWKLPMIFVCENNQYALTTSYRQTTSVAQVAERASAYSMPGVTVDGNDVVEVYHVVGEAIERARAGLGPTLVEAMTYRWGQHSMRANLRDPRPGEEYEEWMARDPVLRAEAELAAADSGAPRRIEAIGAEVESEIEAAVEYGRAGPPPTVEALWAAVYAPHAECPAAPPPGNRVLGFPQALNEALDQEMARDERVLLMGEDVGGTGGIFGVSAGLMDKYGSGRVRDTPISEATFVGCGVGAAIAGLRPVVEIQIFDFVALTMDMLVNQAAKFRFMLGGKNTVPLVVRGPQGGGVRLAAQHSQSLEAWFTHVPGLVVVAPSTPYDAKGLLVSAIRDDNPVIFLEAKLSYMTDKGPVPQALYALPIGKADIKREGADVTLIATLAMVPRALAAAEQLALEGVSVEVIDPRTLRPLDEETILASVRKTGRVVIAHEAWVTGGFGAEVAAIVADQAFMDLDAPVRRVGALDVPMPYNDDLERATIPSQDRIAQAIRETAQF